MSRADKAALLWHRDALWAERVLRERGGSLSTRDVFTLTWLATGSKDDAEEAVSKRMLQEMAQRRNR